MTELADSINKFIHHHGSGTSFVELKQHFPDEFRGEYAIKLEDYTVLWTGVTQAFVAAMQELMTAGQIHIRPTTVHVYFCDGAMLNLPLARGSRSYTRPHWLPVVVNAGPPPTSKPKRKRK